MWKSDKLRNSIDIRLENGVYCMGMYSGNGKTFLAKEIEKYRFSGEKVVSYTYNDKLKGIDINKLLSSEEYAVIVIDRYDMYNGYGAETIEECAKKSIVLIDCKNDININCDYDFCEVRKREHTIEVY